jgi:transposase
LPFICRPGDRKRFCDTSCGGSFTAEEKWGERRRAIFALNQQGKLNYEIASQLGISKHAVAMALMSMRKAGEPVRTPYWERGRAAG